MFPLHKGDMDWWKCVAPHPGSQCQGGGRSVCQPRITAHTVTKNATLIEIITSTGTKVLQMV